MGIVGIDDVIYKASHPKLLKELEKEKREYQKLIKLIKRMLKVERGQSKPVSIITKISSSIYSEMKLMKCDSDKLIIKMMIEGSYKSIGILTTKELEYGSASTDIMDLLKSFIAKLKLNINNLKKIDKLV